MLSVLHVAEMTGAAYTTRLQAGLGMIDETRSLLELWHAGVDAPALCQAALVSGRFPKMSARRVRNLVVECFAPRYLSHGARAASLLKATMAVLSAREFEQILLLYTCRANAVLADFVREVYWSAYSAGRQSIDNDAARLFVRQASEQGKTARPWSETTIRRVASYLTGCCADFGLLEGGLRSQRGILPFRIEPRVAMVLAYDLHFAGAGDNRLLADPDWELFGLSRDDALAELKRLSLKRVLIVQTAGNVTRFGWPCKTWGELIDVIAQS